MMITPIPLPPDVSKLERECETHSVLLLAVLQYVQTIPGAPPLPEPLRSIASKIPTPAQLQERIAAIDDAVSAGKTTASSLLHDAGYTWDDAHALAKQWSSWRGERKIATLQRGFVRAALRGGE